jgi:hypothetical protein
VPKGVAWKHTNTPGGCSSARILIASANYCPLALDIGSAASGTRCAAQPGVCRNNATYVCTCLQENWMPRLQEPHLLSLLLLPGLPPLAVLPPCTALPGPCEASQGGCRRTQLPCHSEHRPSQSPCWQQPAATQAGSVIGVELHRRHALTACPACSHLLSCTATVQSTSVLSHAQSGTWPSRGALY